MSETDPVVITDKDVCEVSEGREMSLRGRGYVPFPATPGPAPRPAPEADQPQ